MIKKPAFRSEKYAFMFQDESVVNVYHQRPPYPKEVFNRLAELVDPEIDALLDVGTGLGDIARPMATLVSHVDAVDFSERMITRAQTLPGGDHPGINWIVSPVESAPVTGPYGLITAAACLHWFDLNVVIPRFSRLLSSAGYLAIVERNWETGINDSDIIGQYSTNRDFVRWDVVKAIQEEGLFEVIGEAEAGCISWQPTIETYLECRHSQNGLSRERMGKEQAKEFDSMVRERIKQQVAEGTVEVSDGRIQGKCRGTIVWGKPQNSLN